MSKQTANGTLAIKPAKAKATTAQKKRLTKAKTGAPSDVERWLREYQIWKDSYESPARRRAYIRNLCRRIADEFKPEKIILFGSHAYGKPTPQSDVDLLVVMPYEGGCFQQASKISRYLDLLIPMDLLVHTPEYIQYRLKIGDRFIREILEKGKVMYEAPHG
jgi:predicted nucleotidyltransferase